MKENILIITHNMPPFSQEWGSYQRMLCLAKKMKERGKKVFVVCENKGGYIGDIDYEGIMISGVGHSEGFSTDQFQNKSSGIRKIVKRSRVLTKVAFFLDRFIYSEPNQFSGRKSAKWGKENIKKIVSIINEKKIDEVIISGPPFGFFNIIKKIRRKTNANITLDYRDPWVIWYNKKNIAYKKEKKNIKIANKIVASTPTLTEAMINKYKINESKIRTILNGYSNEVWNNINPIIRKRENMVISYVGSIQINDINSFRSPAEFIAAFKEFSENKNDVVLSFVGVADDDLEDSEKIKYLKYGDNNKAIGTIINSDILLVLHTDLGESGKYIVSGKVYDYIKAKKFIMSIGDHEILHKQIVEKYNLGIHCINKKDIIKEKLEELYSLWKQKALIPNYNIEDINYFSREYQNDLYIKFLEE